jgi:hypothetical protein
MRVLTFVVAVCAAALVPSLAHGGVTRMLLESNANLDDDEVFLLTYNSQANLVSNTIDAQAFSDLNISEDFSAADFAFDGAGYHLLLESNLNRDTDEIFLVNYADFADFGTNDIQSQQFLDLNVSEAFSIGGFTFDGSAYHLLLESNANLDDDEVFLVTYNSWDHLLSNTIDFQTFLPLNINEDFSIGGFAHTGDVFQLLLESNANLDGDEVFYLEYADLSALLNNTIQSQFFLPLNINEDFSMNGFEVEPANGGAIPEPAAWALMILGFGLAGGTLRRRRGALV